MSISMKISEEDLPVFLACLGFGTLEAIRLNALHPDVGIWSMAELNFSGVLRKLGLPEDVVHAFAAADELSAAEEVYGRGERNKVIGRLAKRLLEVLAMSPKHFWRLQFTEHAADPTAGSALP